MDIYKLSDALSVAAQITPNDVKKIAELGFKLIINNRPDGEIIGQPRSRALEKAAKANDLGFISIPVSGHIPDSAVQAFGHILETRDGPILAFCRTGTRCATLWALSRADNEPAASILAAANQAGYDLRAIKPRIQARATQAGL